MKIKMNEYYQGSNLDGVLKPGEVYDVDDELATWLVYHRKAEQVAEAAPEPAPEPIAEEPAVVIPEAQEEPKRKRGRK